ncbi:MAG: CBS domain-containing protein [Desulfobulbaceae bacterium]|nr:MAG: CBS domain-containing protein [Desulfobulbaceae bacterium]
MKTAQDIMTREVITVSKSTSVKDLARILVANNISGVPVIDENGVLVGIVTESDLIFQNKKLQIPPVITILDSFLFLHTPEKMEKEMMKIAGASVSDIYTSEVITISPETPLDEIATMMTDKKIHTLPVVTGNRKMVGIVGKKDLLRTIL